MQIIKSLFCLIVLIHGFCWVQLAFVMLPFRAGNYSVLLSLWNALEALKNTSSPGEILNFLKIFQTGAKIIIRGKGSVKEGKLGRREGPMPGENEPLHAYVTGTDYTVIKKACEKVRNF